MGTHDRAPAFPAVGEPGLSKREYVAAQVLAALAPRDDLAEVLSADRKTPEPRWRLNRWSKGLAGLAVTLADALLAELAEPSRPVAGEASPAGSAEENGHAGDQDGAIAFGEPPWQEDEPGPDSGVDLGNCGAEDKP